MGSVPQKKLYVGVVVNSLLLTSVLSGELQVSEPQKIVHLLNCTFDGPPEMKSPRNVCSFLLCDLL